MIDYILGLWANQWIAVGLFWIPLGFCAVGYFCRTWQNVREDMRERADYERAPKSHHYRPKETIGRLLGRGLVSIIPVANLCAAVFDLGPWLFSGFFEWLGRVFDQPLVPVRTSRGFDQNGEG